jgi:FAD synthase
LLIEWLSFLRPEQRFDSLDSLRAQITVDRDAALTWFSRNKLSAANKTEQSTG